MKIKKNDQVKILAGKDRGKTGKVLNVFPVEKRITVENLNLMKKHVRPRKEGEKGQRVEVLRKIDASNAMLICPRCGKATKTGFKKVAEKKTRVCKKCQSEI
jgi:large subunit ribosomal protein L24